MRGLLVGGCKGCLWVFALSLGAGVGGVTAGLGSARHGSHSGPGLSNAGRYAEGQPAACSDTLLGLPGRAVGADGWAGACGHLPPQLPSTPHSTPLSRGCPAGGLPHSWLGDKRPFRVLRHLDLSDNRLGYQADGVTLYSTSEGGWCQAGVAADGSDGWCPTIATMRTSLSKMPNLQSLDISNNSLNGGAGCAPVARAAACSRALHVQQQQQQWHFRGAGCALRGARAQRSRLEGVVLCHTFQREKCVPSTHHAAAYCCSNSPCTHPRCPALPCFACAGALPTKWGYAFPRLAYLLIRSNSLYATTDTQNIATALPVSWVR